MSGTTYNKCRNQLDLIWTSLPYTEVTLANGHQGALS